MTDTDLSVGPSVAWFEARASETRPPEPRGWRHDNELDAAADRLGHRGIRVRCPPRRYGEKYGHIMFKWRWVLDPEAPIEYVQGQPGVDDEGRQTVTCRLCGHRWVVSPEALVSAVTGRDTPASGWVDIHMGELR